MQLIAIENSSTVKAVGFDAGVLRVAFRDGSEYETEATIETFGAFMASPSKGSYIHQHLKGKLKRVDALPASKPEQAIVHGVRLNSVEGDECCGPKITRALGDGKLDAINEWECPKCGMKWTPETHGDIRHWMPRPYVAVLRPRL